MSASTWSAASATRSDARSWVGEVIITRPPNTSTTLLISSSQVATYTAFNYVHISARLSTCSIIGRPSNCASGLPGNRDEPPGGNDGYKSITHYLNILKKTGSRVRMNTDPICVIRESAAFIVQLEDGESGVPKPRAQPGSPLP